MSRLNVYEEALYYAIENDISYTGKREFDVSVELESVNIYASGSYYEEGDVENDYYDGTGAYICTYRSLYIEECVMTDDDGNYIQNEIDIEKVEDYFKEK